MADETMTPLEAANHLDKLADDAAENGGAEIDGRDVNAIRTLVTRMAKLEVERAGLKVMWEFRYGDGEFETKERALEVAAEHGCADEGDGAVCWRLVGQWQDASTADAESEA